MTPDPCPDCAAVFGARQRLVEARWPAMAYTPSAERAHAQNVVVHVSRLSSAPNRNFCTGSTAFDAPGCACKTLLRRRLNPTNTASTIQV